MRYWAFLSYSHRDRKWGDWLHKALETYRVPRRLVGKDSRDGKVPERLYPIFRDREELPVSADLGVNIDEALKESRYLIVICSPRSAQSRWVAEEIKMFKKLGRENRILALIVDGEPNASDGKAGFSVADECFPAPMRYRLAENGELSPERTEPIAADARESGDGKNNAKLKLLAGLLGVSYDDLKRRDQDRRLRRARAIGAAALVLVLIFAALAVALFFKEREAQSARTAAVEAEQQTKLRASKADADIGVQLAGSGDETGAFAHAVRALELNPKNSIAAILAYRLLSNGPLALPAHLLTHSSVVKALAFSRDGGRLATGCDDGSIVVVDLDTGDRFVLADKPLASVLKLAFSPDGRAVAFATTDQAEQKSAVRTWQYLTSDKPVLVYDNFKWYPLELAWPLPDRIVVYDGRDWGSGADTFVFGLTDTAAAWDLMFAIGHWWDNEPAPARFVETENTPKSWVVDTTGMLVVHDNMKLSWLDLRGIPDINKPLFAVNTLDDDIVDVAEQTGIAIIGTNFTKKLESRRSYLDDNDPKRRAVLKWVDPLLRKQATIPLLKGTLFDRVSADGKRLLCLKENAPVILDRYSGKELASASVQASVPDLLAFSADGNSLVVGRSSHAVISEFYAEDNDPHVATVAIPARVTDADLDFTGKWLAVSSNDKTVRVWSREALRRPALSLSKPKSAMQVETDSYQVQISRANANTSYRLDGTYLGEEFDICRVDPHTSQCNHVSRLQEPQGAGSTVTGYSFSPDGARVAVAYGDFGGRPDNNPPSVAVLYDTATGRMIGEPLHHDGKVFSPCYSPDGKWFITLSDDRTLRRWDGRTGTPIGDPIRLPSRRRFAKVSPDGRLIVTSQGEVVDTGSWQVIKELTPNRGYWVNAFFSLDGLWLATISAPFGRGESGTDILVELSQWDLQNAVQIAEPIEIVPSNEQRESGGGAPTRWLEPGQRLIVGTDLVWQCTMPCSVESILPFLQACRPLILGEAGEQIINAKCSLDSLSIKNFFPEGRTTQNQAAYDFAERVLNRGATDRQR